MRRVFLIEKGAGGRRIDLGCFKFNDELRCIEAAKKRHKFIEKMQTNSFGFFTELEHGPLRRPAKPQAEKPQQLSIEG